MPNFQDGADAYGAYTQGSHIKGVVRKRFMGGGLAQFRRDQVRDGTEATAFNTGGLSSRAVQTTGTKGAEMEQEARMAAARQTAAQRGAARAAAEANTASRPPLRPDQPMPKGGTVNDSGQARAPTRPNTPMKPKSSAGLIKYRRRMAQEDDDNDASQEPDQDADDSRVQAATGPQIIRVG